MKVECSVGVVMLGFLLKCSLFGLVHYQGLKLVLGVGEGWDLSVWWEWVRQGHSGLYVCTRKTCVGMERCHKKCKSAWVTFLKVVYRVKLILWLIEMRGEKRKICMKVTSCRKWPCNSCCGIRRMKHFRKIIKVRMHPSSPLLIISYNKVVSS